MYSESSTFPNLYLFTIIIILKHLLLICWLKKNESAQIEKPQQVYLGEKEGERISAIRNTVIHDAENLGLVPVLEPCSDKDSTIEQELANCHAVYDIAT